ncbi:MAG: hypothetical protein ACYDAP_00325 [Thermoplasmataceae archaeon]
MIDARTKRECEQIGGDWVEGYVYTKHGENVYVDAYCRRSKKGLDKFELYDIPRRRR